MIINNNNSISIDNIFLLLKETIFSPILCWYPIIFRLLLQFGYSIILNDDDYDDTTTITNNNQHHLEYDSLTLGIRNFIKWSNRWTIYLIYCLIVSAFWHLTILDRYLSCYRKSRDRFIPNPNNDAVIITGGGSKRGIGRALAKWFQERKYHVIVLDIHWENDEDIKEPLTRDNDEKLPEIQFIKCDVSDYNQVKRLYDSKLNELLNDNTRTKTTNTNTKTTTNTIESTLFPSILINCAGITHDKNLVDLDPEMIKKTIDINLLGPMWTSKCLLESIINKNNNNNNMRIQKDDNNNNSSNQENKSDNNNNIKTTTTTAIKGNNIKTTKYGCSIINISSVLGIVGPSQLTAYSASKAGLRLFHDSLTHEVGEPYYSSPNNDNDNDNNNKNKPIDRLYRKFPINTLLVIPGQINTEMFSGVETPSKFIAPILNPGYVAQEIGNAILTSSIGILYLPFYTRFAWLVWVLPGFIVEFIRKISGMDNKMNSFYGNKNNKN